MKRFLVILVASFLGSFVYISIAYNFYENDFLSYGDNLLVAFLISLIFSLVGRYTLRMFEIRNMSLSLGLAFFIAQIVAYLLTLAFSQFGILTMGIAIILCALGAAFCLRLIEKRKQ